MDVGLRVVRGPDWKWGNQDGGDGNVGTVVEIGKPGSPSSPDKTVVVQWDAGARTNYRVGYQGAYDLRVWDNAPVGVKFQNIVCDGCKCQGISGMRWKCQLCKDFDLCTSCFMEDKHDLAHSFSRYENASSFGVILDKRQSMIKLQVKGIFVGAKVVRGPDWDWGNQDGGEGKIGRVVDLRGWDNESGRSVANVAWASGSTNVYRLGHKGKVDLKCVHAAVGGYYYREALPVLGLSNDSTSRPSRGPSSPSAAAAFSVGDKVKVTVDADRLREMQEGHGGWNPRMVECIGHVGTVHRVTERGDIRVQFDGSNQRWTFHPRAIYRLSAFSVGDAVRLTDDIVHVKLLQRGHGEWVDLMRLALGKIGKVTKVYDDGDLRVTVDGQTWTLNPLCLTPLPGSATELHNTMAASVRQEHINPLASLLSHLLVSGPKQQQQQPLSLSHPSYQPGTLNEGTIADRLVRAAAQGQFNIFEQLLLQHPDKANAKSSGKTCLQVASHQGHTELVGFLLSKGASMEIADDDGDTALHYAAFGNQPEVMELLIKKGAIIDSTNRGRCTPLHVAVNKQFPACVQMLLKYGCDVNVQDSYGDTALHDAIGKENADIIEALASSSAVDCTLRNTRGFNVLHHAALKGNYFAAERILMRSRQLVDVKKDDGFAALHLASLNGHVQMAKLLLDVGQCCVDPLNNRRQTPLLLAVSQGHAPLVELLVEAGADVTAADEDGDTGIHVACLKLHSLQGEASTTMSPNIFSIQQCLHANGRNPNHSLALAIACYLVQLGCNPEVRNRRNKTCADLIADSSVWETLMSYVNHRTSLSPASVGGEIATESDSVVIPCETKITSKGGSPDQSLPPSAGIECIVCCENPPDVRFEPCGHVVTCSECAQRMKKCLKCHVVIVLKANADGTPISSHSSQQPSKDRLKYLESRIAEIEEAYTCSICMERRRNVAFLCGHGACDSCSQTLRTCHMCRKLIARKINLY
ncbi:E3 ubiquitin-protein ligase MIB2-like [Daphnia carinata]|uniref:E3 ubiquitin-protein ligase MIB2-like n=1 Tax=Daphnia carinata TaxID=120202 RepID=UPI00257C741C|nr:E3 ubiquitin-protein ligase MIB2-like [Daphnia carinata]